MTKIVSIFETVSFPEYGMSNMVAKIDTGAYTGAMHCTNIREEQVGDGAILHFSPFDSPELVKTVDNFFVRYIKSSNGRREKRYIIETTVVIQGNEYPIILSLADRSEMKYPVLIGRRFLRDNDLLVDVRKASE